MASKFQESAGSRRLFQRGGTWGWLEYSIVIGGAFTLLATLWLAQKYDELCSIWQGEVTDGIFNEDDVPFARIGHTVSITRLEIRRRSVRKFPLISRDQNKSVHSNKSAAVYYRGMRIWKAVMDDLLSKGMANVKKGFFTGCLAGGLASFLHCDQLKELMPKGAKVKCLSDAASSFKLFFPTYLLSLIKTPFFVLNPGYDNWQEFLYCQGEVMTWLIQQVNGKIIRTYPAVPRIR
ncbi:hypothetical protein R1flu_028481 [Riccia fluitans]|uniref:Pectin acetylesterase n=1 Tax=Riccia fluitans TaxID=41844 RepID=A0ABD1XLS4_9MARC